MLAHADAVQALSCASTRSSALRTASPEIATADARAQTRSTSAHLDPLTPGRVSRHRRRRTSAAPPARAGSVKAPAWRPTPADEPASRPPLRRGPGRGRSGAGAARRRTLEELLAELDALIGLTEVKAEIHRQVAVLRVEGLRQQGRPAGRPRSPGTWSSSATRAPARPPWPGWSAGSTGRSGLLSQGPAGRGRPLRAGRRLPRPDRDEDRRGGGLARPAGCCSSTRRTAWPATSTAGGGRHPGQGDGGPARRPGADRGRLSRPDGRSSSPRTPGWPAGSGPPSSSPTTPTTSWSRSSPAGRGRRLRRRRRSASTGSGPSCSRTPRGPDVRQRPVRPQPAGGGDRPARLAAARRGRADRRPAAEAARRGPAIRRPPTDPPTDLEPRAELSPPRPPGARRSEPRTSPDRSDRERARPSAGPPRPAPRRPAAHRRAAAAASGRPRRASAAAPRPGHRVGPRTRRDGSGCSASGSSWSASSSAWSARWSSRYLAYSLTRAEADTAQLIRVQKIQTNLLVADATATNAFLVGGLEPPAQRAAYDQALTSHQRADRRGGPGPASRRRCPVGPQPAAWSATRPRSSRRGPTTGRAARSAPSTCATASAAAAQPRRCRSWTTWSPPTPSGPSDGWTCGSATSSWSSPCWRWPALIVGQVWLARRFKRTDQRRHAGRPRSSCWSPLVGGTIGLQQLSDTVGSIQTGSFAAVNAAADARIDANNAKSNESLTLIARGSGGAFETAWKASAESVVGQPRAGWAGRARPAGSGRLHDGAQQIRELDDGGEWDRAVALATGTGPESANTAFNAFDASLAGTFDQVSQEPRPPALSAATALRWSSARDPRPARRARGRAARALGRRRCGCKEYR